MGEAFAAMFQPWMPLLIGWAAFMGACEVVAEVVRNRVIRFAILVPAFAVAERVSWAYILLKTHL